VKINEIINEGTWNALKGVAKHYAKDWFNLTDADINDLVRSFKPNDVMKLQQELKAAGANVPTTGVIDQSTKEAIKQNPQVIAPPEAIGMGKKFKKATQTSLVPPSQQVAQQQQTTASTPAPAPTATPAPAPTAPTATPAPATPAPATPAPATPAPAPAPATPAPATPAPATPAPAPAPTAPTATPAPAEPKLNYTLGGKKLDPRNPNDAKVIAALQAQQAAAQTKQ
jgi:hypothetical protein